MSFLTIEFRHVVYSSVGEYWIHYRLEYEDGVWSQWKKVPVQSMETALWIKDEIALRDHDERFGGSSRYY